MPTPKQPPASSDASGVVTTTRGRLTACAVVVAAFLLPAVAVMVAGVRGGAQYQDEQEFHQPTIESFVRQWPHLDFSRYAAAMTPGYHVAMAALERAGGGLTAARFATAGITCGLLATLAWAASARVQATDAVLLCLPMAWSQYVFTSGVYAVPHNLSWWCVLGGILIALRPRVSASTYVLGGAVLAAAVLTRQVHVWLAAPLVTAAWTGGEGGPSGGRVRRAVVMSVALLPAVAALGWFVHLWGGLTPPGEPWAKPVGGGVEPATFAMMLATAGALGIAYAVCLLAASVPNRTRWAAGRWTWMGSAAGAVVALIGKSAYDPPAGRWGGLWNAARLLPSPGERSPVIILLAAIGGGVTGLVAGRSSSRDRWVLAAAVVGFAAAHGTISQAWQRYYEPFVLMVLVLAVARCVAGRVPRAGKVALALLSLGQAALTVFALR